MLGLGLVIVFLVFSIMFVSAERFRIDYTKTHACTCTLKIDGKNLGDPMSKVVSLSPGSHMLYITCDRGHSHPTCAIETKITAITGTFKDGSTKKLSKRSEWKGFTAFYGIGYNAAGLPSIMSGYNKIPGADALYNLDTRLVELSYKFSTSAACVPTTEVCDGKDNDCDGNIDEDVTRSCGSSNVGECSFGTQSCSAGNWNTCSGEIFSSVETCDNLDNDCDGDVDEGCNTHFCNAINLDVYKGVRGTYARPPTGLSGDINYVNLDRSNTDLTAADLDGVDVLIIGDRNFENPVQWANAPNYVNPLDTELAVIKTAWKNGMDVILIGDNGQGASGLAQKANYWSAIITNHLTDSMTYTNYAINYGGSSVVPVTPNLVEFPFLNGAQFSLANNGIWSPGLISASSPAKCAARTSLDGNCFVSYLPEASDHGYLFVSGNAFLGSDVYTKNLIEQSCTVSKTYYRDADDDKYGNLTDFVSALSIPAGYVTDNQDCDDNDVAINPGAIEICDDGVDNNCDGQKDEGCGTLNTYYLDSDGDDYGNSTNSITAYSAPIGYVDNGNDCNDNDANINPLASDSDCNGIDNNCNILVDEDYVVSATSCGLGICASTGSLECINGDEFDSCSMGAPNSKKCDGLDNDCDGVIDDNCINPDDSSPIINLIAPFGGQIFYGAFYFVNFIFDVNDQSDISSCYVNVSGNLHNVDNISKTVSNSVEVNLSSGNYSAMVFCNDTFGNLGNSSEVLFSVEQFGICSVDANCSDDYKEARYCDGDDLYETFHDFSCIGGNCVENVSEVLVKECRYDCKRGRCVSDGDDDDDDPSDYFVVGGVGLDLINVSDNVYLESRHVDDVGLFWIWILLLIAGIVLLMIMIVWARVD